MAPLHSAQAACTAPIHPDAPPPAPGAPPRRPRLHLPVLAYTDGGSLPIRLVRMPCTMVGGTVVQPWPVGYLGAPPVMMAQS